MNQILIVVMAITLLGVLLLPTARISLSRQQVLISSEAGSTATAIGQELLEEISVRKFDENKCGRTDSTNNANDFSATLGVDAGENASDPRTFDDVDDFNGYTTTVSSPRLGSFLDTVKVYYVTDTTPDAVSGSQTFFKRIDVRVWNKYLFTQDTVAHSIALSKIISYRYRGGS